MCTHVINLMVQICNLYAGTLKKFTTYTCWASLIKPVSHSWGVESSALIYSLYQAAYLLPERLNKTPAICQLLSQQRPVFKDILAFCLKAVNSNVLSRLKSCFTCLWYIFKQLYVFLGMQSLWLHQSKSNLFLYYICNVFLTPLF